MSTPGPGTIPAISGAELATMDDAARAFLRHLGVTADTDDLKQLTEPGGPDAAGATSTVSPTYQRVGCWMGMPL